VLRGGRAITMKGDEIIENADVVIRDNRIIGVGRRGEVEVPAAAQVIDVTGRTLVPGFVDVHYHAQWLIPEIHPRQAWQYLTNLAYGVTTTRDPQTGSDGHPELRRPRRDRWHDRTAHLLDGARRLLQREPAQPGARAHRAAPLCRVLRHEDAEDVHDGQPSAAAVDHQAAKELKLMPTTEGGLD
jgi:hypothetical protein